MLPPKDLTRQWISKKILLTALAFGAGALLIMVSKIAIPLPGTHAVTDPREVLVTLGAALTGPAGSIIIGLLAGVMEFSKEIRVHSMVIHVLAGLWMGFSYKLLVYNRPRVPFIAGWAGLVLVYYFLFLIPLSVGIISTSPLLYAQMYGEGTPTWQAYRFLATAALPEVVFTTFITTLVMFALSKRYNRPLW